ncbi:MFS transporter [Lacticaseibacillus suibinensis]|uniref:MFS transporter n=1 Tax=Lacticaseibacillus suibinensis TaxID=2486011 RepID=UPI000F79C29D|nr:MFS transporter [Lacticaseibacillus suibinensis]
MRRWLNLMILGVFFFMVIVDGSIVTIAIPAMAHGLAVGTERVGLVISIYLVTISALLLPFGQLGAQWGRERCFMLGTLAFLVGSWLTGAGAQLSWVLGGRVLQGVGASLTMANSYALVADWFPPQQLGRAFGIESIFISLGGLAGPGLGGLVLTHWDWRYLFWLNLPIGGLCLVAAVLWFPRTASRQRLHLDWGGTGLLMALAIVFYVSTASSLTQPGLALLGLALSGGLLWLLVRWEQHRPHPLLNLALLKTPAFGWPLAAAFTTFVAAYYFTLLGPIYLQVVVGLSPAATGAVLMAGPLVAIVANPLAGMAADRWSQPRVMQNGLLLLLVSALGLVLLTGQFEPLAFLLVSVVMAIGTSVFGTANSAFLMREVTPAQRGAAGALTALLREVGLVLGVSLASTSFYGSLGALARQPLTTALGQPVSRLLTAQHLAYALAAVILLGGWWLNRRLLKSGHAPRRNANQPDLFSLFEARFRSRRL